MNKKNRYGYKVGYCKNGSRLFIRKFITRTHKQAYQMLVFYRKFGAQRVVQKFNYEIQPITKKEVLEGIWDELPFLYKCPGHYLYRWAHCSIVKTQSQREKIFGFHKDHDFCKNFCRFSLTSGERSTRTWYAHFHYATSALPIKANKNIGVKECIKKTNLELLTSGEMEICFMCF